MDDIFAKIRLLMTSMPRAEKVMAEAVLENPEAISKMTLAEVARESGASEATIIRFCRRVGYSGFSDMKMDLKKVIPKNGDPAIEELRSSDDMRTIMKKVFQSNIQTMTNTMALANNSYENAVNAIVSARSLHFFGVGDAYAVCLLAMMKFVRTGLHCNAYSDVMLQLVDASNCGKGDVAIAISYEGRSKAIVDSMRIARKNGATTICITKMIKSPLARSSDIRLLTSVNDLTVGRDKVTRRIADQFVMDALYLGYTVRKGPEMNKIIKSSQEAIETNKIIGSK